MARKRKIETEEQRSERLGKNVREIRDARANEEEALDAMVRQSIKQQGA